MPDIVGRFFDTIAETRDPRAAVRAVAIDFDIPDGPGIVDPDTFRAIEVQRLFDTLNTCRTTIGQASLWASLCRPCDSLPAIEARQQALRELDARDDLRGRLESLVGWAEKGESILYHLLFGAFTGMLGTAAGKLEFDGYGYSQYRHGTRFLLEISAMARDLPRPDSAYLNELIDALTGFAETRVSALMRGPVYLTERGIRLSDEKPKWWPAFRFRPSLFKPGLLIAFALCVVLLSQLNPFPAGLPVSPVAGISFVLLLPVALLYVPAVGGFDRDQFVYPLRDRFRAADEVRRALAALGRIDELLALHRYARSFGSATVLPRVVDSPRHFLRLRGARNPVLGFGNRDYVPNHIDLETTRLTFITGPNSGGKTALCKTIAQVQLLAQIGGYVPASEAEVAISDRIFYQTPEAGSLTDAEGRFGTELARTKSIFLGASPKSLVILDEMAEGTTYEEKLAISEAILSGFARIGNSTILITHNHELVERFRRRRSAACRQVEFAGEAPTYRLIDGISTVSHADRIAKRLGFSREDIESYLRQRGYA
jgi:DNA mismatch repair protein MutS